MKWSKFGIISVIAILSISYVYSNMKQKQLSDDVLKMEMAACAKNGAFDCNLITRYHDECFAASVRAELKTRSFHEDEYRACIRNKSGLSSDQQ